MPYYTGCTFIAELYQGDNKLQFCHHCRARAIWLIPIRQGRHKRSGDCLARAKFRLASRARPSPSSLATVTGRAIQDGSGIMSLTKTGTERWYWPATIPTAGSACLKVPCRDGTVSGAVMVDGGTLTGLLGGTVTVAALYSGGGRRSLESWWNLPSMMPPESREAPMLGFADGGKRWWHGPLDLSG